MNRDTQIARQVLSGTYWAKIGKGRGTIEAYTGVGKTYIAKYIIDRLKLNTDSLPVVVIVPTTDLKIQWESKFLEWNIDGEVFVINGIVIKETILKAKLIIYDEVHLMLQGKLFNTIFDLTKSIKYALALTATLTPKFREVLKNIGLPIVDIITLKEGRENNWVAEYTQYNYGIELTSEERETYNYYHSKFESYFATFDYNWDIMMGCTVEEDEVVLNEKGESIVIKQGARNYCIQNGLGIDAINDCKRNAFQAIQWNAKYKSFLYNCQSKLQITKEIINKFGVKSLTFGMSIESANKLAEMMPESVACHSKVEGKEVPKDLLFKYGMEKSGGSKWKKISSSKVNELNIKMFNSGEISVVHSAKKLVQGVDIKELALIVIYAYDSSAIKEIQIIGRGIRKEQIGNKNKKTIIFKIFIKDSKDESWIEKSQKGIKGIKTIYNLDEI